MPKPRVLIDGHVGTVGLRIREWLASRDDLELVALEGAARRDPGARRDALQACDLAVLCLPDDAAREVAAWTEPSKTRLLDSSTAHRTAQGWIYGLPEIEPGQRESIASARRVSNPGCYPTAFLLLLRPLVDAGLLPADARLGVTALSGYSGGGRALIERWEDPDSGLLHLTWPAPYALERVHKHVPEMTRYAGLHHEPQFVPAVGPFRCGMRVLIPLPAGSLTPGASAKDVWSALDSRYDGERFVRVHAFEEPFTGDERVFDPRRCNDTNRIELWAVGHPSGHVTLVACLDNLGKGAAGAAIQNLNLMLGLPEDRGLPA